MAVRAFARPLAAGLALALTACAGEIPPAGVASGLPFPAYAAPTLHGDTLSLDALRGEVVLLNVWATWCPPCRREMPGLQALQEDFAARGLRVVGVSVDAASDGERIEAFLRESGVGFTVLHDPEGRIRRTLNGPGIPETLLIARDGTLLRRWIGRVEPGSAGMRAAIDEALRRG